MQTRAVIVDRDNTVLTLEPAAAAQVEARLAALAPGLSLGAVQAVWERWRGPWPRFEAEEPAFWRMFCADVARAHGRSCDSNAMAALLDALYHTCFCAFPEANEALCALRDQGLRLAVLSNFELPSIARTLAHAGLDPAQFDVILNASAVGYAKPHPRAYLAVAEALGLPPAACCLVDDLTENVAGARLVGMRAFQIDRALPRGDGSSGTISSLLDLVGLFEAARPRDVASAPYDLRP